MNGYVVGDLDIDGMLGVDDIDLWTQAVLLGRQDPEFDLNDDGNVDQQDRIVWIEQLKRTYLGDANIDGLFQSDDLVMVLAAGQYEDDILGNSTWATGDTSEAQYSQIRYRQTFRKLNESPQGAGSSYKYKKKWAFRSIRFELSIDPVRKYLLLPWRSDKLRLAPQVHMQTMSIAAMIDSHWEMPS